MGAAQRANLANRSDFHGVGPLLYAHLPSSDWPTAVWQELRVHAVQQAMWELRHHQVLTQALAALDVIGVQPVLIKGTALAYSLYADPVLRTRGDTDLIVPISSRHRVHQVLVSMGFERVLGVSGEFVSYQANYTRRAPDGSSHTLDVHWKINNSELLSRLFTYDELVHDARPLPQLSPRALGASPVQALLLSCMHRSTHKQNPYYVNDEPHHDANRLIWLYDIHLLAGTLSTSEWEQFASLASKKHLRAVCLEGMQQAHSCFRTAYPAQVLTALTEPGAREPAAHYLNGSKLRQQWMDFWALDTFSTRLGFARELFFPPPAYMRTKYGDESQWLPWLYLRRAATGVVKKVVGGRAAS